MRRIPELDAVRGLAAVVIVVYHLWFPALGLLGTVVDLFFVMSGYLITSIILENLDQPGFLITFHVRRSLRIWPIYYLSLALFLAVNHAIPKPYPTDGLALFLSYTQNVPEYWGAANPPFAHGFFHTWSLAIEEQFYLVWPLVLVLFGRRAVVPLSLGMIVLAVGTRMGGMSRWVLLTKCDGLALGALLAVSLTVIESGRASLEGMKRVVVTLGTSSVAYLTCGGMLARWSGHYWPPLGFPGVSASLRMLATNILFFSVTAILVIESGHPRLSFLRGSWLIELGQMSYGIYLYHYLLFDLIQDHAVTLGLSNRLVLDGIKLTATFGLAAVSWRLFERPLLSLKDRFGYRARAGRETASLSGVSLMDQLQPRVR